MTKPDKKQREWEKEFEGNFGGLIRVLVDKDQGEKTGKKYTEELKSFIRKTFTHHRQEVIEEVKEKMNTQKIWLHALSFGTVTESVFLRSQGWDDCLSKILIILDDALTEMEKV